MISPLDWGLGHASRCIPLIEQIIRHGYLPILAGDGSSLELLKKEFPKLKCYNLPSYGIAFPAKSRFLRFYFLLKIPSVLSAMYKEKQQVDKIVQNEGIKAIISDERWGVRSNRVPSVIISHQLKVLSGYTTWLTSFVHRVLINKFDECWVPDFPGKNNLTGKLSKSTRIKIPLKFIGVLSRNEKERTDQRH